MFRRGRMCARSKFIGCSRPRSVGSTKSSSNHALAVILQTEIEADDEIGDRRCIAGEEDRVHRPRFAAAPEDFSHDGFVRGLVPRVVELHGAHSR